ncbi:MAG TPA: DUF202 domain-containing protein [Rhodanobacteraceae bacterium]|nr:DUF202 domain-containing protein [Rhodanobacteraceae bacterium]
MAEDEDARVLDTFRQMAALQARVCYMNVDRTLATWTRTALALIVFGTIVDRYGMLLLRDHLPHVGTRLAPNPVSSAGGIFLVAIGVFIAVTAAIRHQRYRTTWNRSFGRDESFGPWLALPFAVGVAMLGIAMLVLLLVLAQ